MNIYEIHNILIKNKFDISEENDLILHFINEIEPLIIKIIKIKIGKIYLNHEEDLLNICKLLITEILKKNDKKIIDIKKYIIKSILNKIEKYLSKIKNIEIYENNEFDINSLNHNHNDNHINIFSLFNNLELKIIDLYYSGKTLENIEKELKLKKNQIYLIWERIKLCLMEI